ncbi:MAG: response regulator, partial [Planctomycetota bacterium]|nr:response regulator [Planctomycetota bacterium]
MTLMPLGTALDYMVYPDLQARFLAIRLIASALVVVVYLLHKARSCQDFMPALNISWVLAINAGLCVMIGASEGAASPYYAGLNLVFLAMILLMPLTWIDALVCCGVTVLFYLVACIAHGDPLSNLGILFNNLYFLSLTALVCCIASAYLTGMRKAEFALRHELDNSNRDLASSNDKLAELVRLRAQFIANISHELRTPLTLILGPVDDLLTSGRNWDRTTAESLGLARENGLRLLKLINDLLELVRLEDGGVRLERQAMDLAPFLAALVDSVRYLADAKGVHLHTEGPDQGLVVRGDSARLEKVFLNLITNALKFTPTGGTVTVSWRHHHDSTDISVCDTGIGIPADQLPFIFERFRQVDGTTTRQFQGAGLGLALVKELVSEHEGSVHASSQLDQGSTFTVTLPRSTDAVAAATHSSHDVTGGDRSAELFGIAERRGGVALDADHDSDSNEAQGTGPRRILVVDDEPDMRRYLVAGLAETHTVFQAADGPSALESAWAHQPDLILLDLMLPGIDGLEVCTQLRASEACRHCKIILLTARGDEKAKLDALKRGADDFLTKPFSFVEVQTRIDNLLRARRLEIDLQTRATELQTALEQVQETEARLIQ